jgi:hypothetical protein
MHVSLSVSHDQWNPIRDQILAHGGLTVPAQGALPALFSRVSVQIHVDETALPLLTGQVVQIFGAAQIAVLLDDASRLAVSQGVSHAPPVSHHPASALADQPSVRSDAPSRRLKTAADPGDEPVWKQVEGASKIDLIRLAKFGNESERRHILKQSDASLHLHVLLNPGITPREVAQVIRANAVQLNFLLRVLERPDLWQNPTVAEALVLNPLTPAPSIGRLIEKVSLDAARRMAKSNDLRKVVVAAATKRALSGR